jgi:hypothetical protein
MYDLKKLVVPHEVTKKGLGRKGGAHEALGRACLDMRGRVHDEKSYEEHVLQLPRFVQQLVGLPRFDETMHHITRSPLAKHSASFTATSASIIKPTMNLAWNLFEPLFGGYFARKVGKRGESDNWCLLKIDIEARSINI